MAAQDSEQSPEGGSPKMSRSSDPHCTWGNVSACYHVPLRAVPGPGSGGTQHKTHTHTEKKKKKH